MPFNVKLHAGTQFVPRSKAMRRYCIIYCICILYGKPVILHICFILQVVYLPNVLTDHTFAEIEYIACLLAVKAYLHGADAQLTALHHFLCSCWLTCILTAVSTSSKVGGLAVWHETYLKKSSSLPTV